MRTIHVRQAVENLVCQHASRRENDFASSITFGERQVIAQSVVKRLLVYASIGKGFQGCCYLLARCCDLHELSARLAIERLSWPTIRLLLTFGDSGSLKQNCYERGEGGELENPC
jgi:hypothetical protein